MRTSKISAVMKIFLFMICLLIVAVKVKAGIIKSECSGDYYNWILPTIINDKMKEDTLEICGANFGVMYSLVTQTPLWVAEHLYRSSIENAKKDKTLLYETHDFYVEDEICEQNIYYPMGCSQFEKQFIHYINSGFDRGMLTGRENNGFYIKGRYSSRNIVPLDKVFNRGLWAAIQSATRESAIKREEIYIITGTLFLGEKLKMIGRKTIVPTHLYTIIFDPKLKQGAVYLAENSSEVKYVTISIDDMEKISNIIFFLDLSTDKKMNKIQLPSVMMKDGEHKIEIMQDVNMLNSFKELLNKESLTLPPPTKNSEDDPVLF